MKIILIFLSIFSFTSCRMRNDPGSGKKIGRIVMLCKKGLFFKTWEGELIRGGLNDGSGSMGSSFHFTIENSILADQALKFMEEQSEVIIDYEIEFISKITRSECAQPNFVKKITKNKGKYF